MEGLSTKESAALRSGSRRLTNEGSVEERVGTHATDRGGVRLLTSDMKSPLYSLGLGCRNSTK